MAHALLSSDSSFSAAIYGTNLPKITFLFISSRNTETLFDQSVFDLFSCSSISVLFIQQNDIITLIQNSNLTELTTQYFDLCFACRSSYRQSFADRPFRLLRKLYVSLTA